MLHRTGARCYPIDTMRPTEIILAAALSVVAVACGEPP